MRMPRCSSNDWRYNPTYGAAGLAVAGILLLLMRHDPVQGLSFAAIMATTAGWTHGRRIDGEAASSDGS
jgi:hypothetical protein